MTWTWKDWINPALLAMIVALLAWQAARGPTSTTDPHPAPAPAPPAVKPDPAPRPPAPRPDPTPQPKDTPLSRAMRDYLRQAPATLPDTLDAMADKLDARELADKASSVAFFKRPASAMNAALDQVFSPGIDKDGKVTDPGEISGPLRDSARALRRAK
jgi:hypothetical protein